MHPTRVVLVQNLFFFGDILEWAGFVVPSTVDIRAISREWTIRWVVGVYRSWLAGLPTSIESYGNFFLVHPFLLPHFPPL